MRWDFASARSPLSRRIRKIAILFRHCGWFAFDHICFTLTWSLRARVVCVCVSISCNALVFCFHMENIDCGRLFVARQINGQIIRIACCWNNIIWNVTITTSINKKPNTCKNQMTKAIFVEMSSAYGDELYSMKAKPAGKWKWITIRGGATTWDEMGQPPAIYSAK